jgi:7-carboxy-7-deazaguanine synthase (Cx14CxxC type)
MRYSVKELFYTLQGEGCQTGRPAVFCRFAGCNLWTGRENDRSSAICRFCDTDFVGTNGPGGGTFESPRALVTAALNLWPAPERVHPFVVCTGGEPLLQLDPELLEALHQASFEVAVETNGTVEAPPGIDWVCVSPKAGTELVVRSGDELKLVFPQNGAPPELYEELAFRHFLLSPMDSPELARNTRLALEYCLAHPRWRLTLQVHKLLGIR